MKKAQLLQVITKSEPSQVLFQEHDPVAVAKWLVSSDHYPVIEAGERNDFKIVGGNSVFLVNPGLINLFVETFIPEIVDSKKGMAQSKAASTGLLESGVSFEYIWQYLGEEEANARLKFRDFHDTGRESHKMTHLKDFHVGELVYWKWFSYGADRVASEKNVRPIGRVVNRSMRPEVAPGRLAIQTFDEPSWLLDIQRYLDKGVVFYSSTEVHQVRPRTAEHERLLAKHQAGTATFEEMKRCHEIESETNSVLWLAKAFGLGALFVYGLVKLFS